MSNDEPQTLKDVAIAALDNNRGISGRALDAEAKKRGLKIVYTTINHMAAGTYNSKPGRQTLEALADLSGYTLEQVYAAAKLPMPLKPLRDDLPTDADSLTGPQRRVVLDTIRLFAQQNLRAYALEAELEKVGTDSGTSAKKRLKVVPATPPEGGNSFAGPDPTDLIDDLAADRPGTPSGGQIARDDQDKDATENQVDPNADDGEV